MTGIASPDSPDAPASPGAAGPPAGSAPRTRRSHRTRRSPGGFLPTLERPRHRRPPLREVAADLDAQAAGNAAVALLFSASGPIAVVLAAAAQGNLSAQETSSWIFGIFLGNGLLTILLSWWYRTPLAFFWTIPGTVLAGDALAHLSLAEVVGAYLATGALVLALGCSGLVARAMGALPPGVVMAMVAGLFLRFGLDMVGAVVDAPLVAVPMIAVFAALTAVPAAGRCAPPVAAAAVAGTLVVLAAGRMAPGALDDGIIAAPVLTAPAFSWDAMVELVVPLAITVIVVQNGQGTAVLRAAGHHPPVNVAAAASGLWTLPLAALGSSPTCLTGPTNALLVSGGRREGHYAAAMLCGAGAVGVGLVAPAFTGAVLAMPAAFIAAFAGVAMLAPLRGTFLAAFGGDRPTGALVCLLVTVSGIAPLGITAPFWGLVAGVAAAAVLDRDRT